MMVLHLDIKIKGRLIENRIQKLLTTKKTEQGTPKRDQKRTDLTENLHIYLFCP